MGTEKFHDLPSASWKTRKSVGIIQFESKGSRIGSQWCKSKSEDLRTKCADVQELEKLYVPAQREKIHPSSVFLLHSDS